MIANGALDYTTMVASNALVCIMIVASNALVFMMIAAAPTIRVHNLVSSVCDRTKHFIAHGFGVWHFHMHIILC